MWWKTLTDLEVIHAMLKAMKSVRCPLCRQVFTGPKDRVELVAARHFRRLLLDPKDIIHTLEAANEWLAEQQVKRLFQKGPL